MQRNIDQLFKNGVEELGGTPAGVQRDPDASWDRIDGMLGEERKRRRGAWIWVSAAASVALLIALAWGMQSRSTARDLTDGKELAGSDGHPLGMTDSAYTLDDRQIGLPQDQRALQFAAKEQPSQIVGNGIVNQQQLESLFDKPGSPIETGKANQNKSIATATITNSTTFACNSSSTNISTYGALTFKSNVSLPTYNYQWTTTNGTTATLNGDLKTAGTYAVQVTDANGCRAGKKVPLGKTEKTNFSFFNRAKADVSIPNVTYMENPDLYGSESYAETVENLYFMAVQEPLSTFSIDVDHASYTNHRRFITESQLPPKYSVRAEEFINYFPYSYPQPHWGQPFSITPEMTTCPWNPKHKLARIALKGREVSLDNIPASNIVFLLDVSGSMSDANKLPLLKQALSMLTEQLRSIDKVSIVVYAGAAGLVLPPTSGNNKPVILNALDHLEAGGSTAGGEGIELAYATAKQNFVRGGNNRIVLATDGDFNVGTSDETGLEKLIVKKREEGVFLSVLGFGEGNLQDSKMELLADKGNGNYNYIDSEHEAKKVLVSEFGGTMYTIAKDVKVQVEFNPAQVSSYRLVGYENRKLKNEDFANDKIDAGELGAGHTVTALYEIVPAGTEEAKAEGLKYSTRVVTNGSNEVLTVKLRYKDPDGSVSKLIEQPLLDDGRNITQTSNDFRWAVAVAEYALILRQSDYKGIASFEQVMALAKSAIGSDKEGYRKEFIDLVGKAMAIQQSAKLNVGGNQH